MSQDTYRLYCSKNIKDFIVRSICINILYCIRLSIIEDVIKKEERKAKKRIKNNNQIKRIKV